MAQEMAFGPDQGSDEEGRNATAYVGDGEAEQVEAYDSTKDGQQWWAEQHEDSAQQHADRLNKLRLQLERCAAREGISTGAIIERLEEAAPLRASWTEFFDEEKVPFYVNEATSETRWQLPRPHELGLELEPYLDALLSDDPKVKDDKLQELARKKSLEEEESVMTEGSWEEGETEEERLLREALELSEREAWEEKERLRLEQEAIDEEHFRKGEIEARQASVALLARTFYSGVREEVTAERVKNWVLEKRDAHEKQQREMYKTMKAEMKVAAASLKFQAGIWCRGDGVATPPTRDRMSRRSAPRPSPSTSSRPRWPRPRESMKVKARTKPSMRSSRPRRRLLRASSK